MQIIFFSSFPNLHQQHLRCLDPRTNDWPLMKSPVPGVSIILLYLYFVNVAGPRFMKDRKPYQMKTTLIVYNFLQVLVSVYIFVEVSHLLVHIYILALH